MSKEKVSLMLSSMKLPAMDSSGHTKWTWKGRTEGGLCFFLTQSGLFEKARRFSPEVIEIPDREQ